MRNHQLNLFAAAIVCASLAGFYVNCAWGQTASKPEAAAVPPSNIDLSTNEAVLKELQKRVDAKSDAPGGKGGRKLDAKSVCIERLKESEKVIMIGFFRYDYGCHFDGAFVDSRYFESADAALSKEALATLGWAKAPKREREMLASYWVQKGLLAFSTVLQTKDKDLNANEFHPPRAVTAEDDEIWVTLWIQMPPRMRRGKEFKRVEYKFAKDGNRIVSETNTGTEIELKTFSHSNDRERVLPVVRRTPSERSNREFRDTVRLMDIRLNNPERL